MQFTPTDAEIMLSFIRNRVQSKIYREKDSENIKRASKLLFKISALFDSSPLKAEINKSINEFLTACCSVMLLENEFIDFKIDGDEKGFIRKNELSYLLLETLTLKSKKMRISVLNNKIVISAFDSELSDCFKRFCKRKKIAYYICESKSIVVVPFTPCTDGTVIYNKADLVKDPLSCVNLYLR